MAELCLLDEREAATRLRLSHRTLQRWRVAGKGPPFHKLGRAIRYAVRDLDAFATARLRHSTAECGRAAGGDEVGSVST